MMHIHSEQLQRIKEIARSQAQGHPPIDGGIFLDRLEAIAGSYPQTLLELIRHVEEGDPLTPGPYE